MDTVGNVEKISGSVKTTSYWKFDNMNDYVAGINELIDTLDEWKAGADEGFDRNYTSKRHDDEMKLEVELEVTPHN